MREELFVAAFLVKLTFSLGSVLDFFYHVLAAILQSLTRRQEKRDRGVVAQGWGPGTSDQGPSKGVIVFNVVDMPLLR